MHQEFVTFLSKHPEYNDPLSDRFMEGMTRALKYMPIREITTYLFKRKRVSRQVLKNDPLTREMMLDEWVKHHMEMIGKVRKFVEDRSVGIYKAYKKYSLPVKQKILCLFKRVWKEKQDQLLKLEPRREIIGFYDVENALGKKIKDCYNICIDPEDKEVEQNPYKIVKESERELQESKTLLAFNYLVYMEETGKRVPLRLFVPLFNYMDFFLCSMLGSYYSTDELQKTLQMTRLELIRAGVESNPGPKCLKCQLSFKLSRQEDLVCANCWRGDTTWALQMSNFMVKEDIVKIIHRCYSVIQCRACCRPFKQKVKIGSQFVQDKLEVINAVVCQDCDKCFQTLTFPSHPQRILDILSQYLKMDLVGEFSVSLISSNHPTFQCIMAKCMSHQLMTTLYSHFWLLLIALNVEVLDTDLHFEMSGFKIVIDDVGDIYYYKREFGFLQLQIYTAFTKVMNLQKFLNELTDLTEKSKAYLNNINKYYELKYDFRVLGKEMNKDEQSIYE
jgi:hypothetical protein